MIKYIYYSIESCGRDIYMQIIRAIVTNHYLIAPIVAWALSQIIKVFTSVAECKRIDIKQIRRDGGMPSSHSATVVTLMTVIGFGEGINGAGISEGFGSAAFAIAFVVGAVIMRDAVGVRRESGKQAEVIKNMAQKLGLDEQELGIAQLKQGGGHTPLQVLVGCLTGLAVGIVYILIFMR